jgi:WhiB family redox-sensing transcriptional regulator
MTKAGKLFDIAERGIPPVALLDDIACRGEDTTLFFPTSSDDTAPAQAAIAICRRCPHQDECLQWALDTKQGYGIWGGTTPAQRRIMRRNQGTQ